MCDVIFKNFQNSHLFIISILEILRGKPLKYQATNVLWIYISNCQSIDIKSFSFNSLIAQLLRKRITFTNSKYCIISKQLENFEQTLKLFFLKKSAIKESSTSLSLSFRKKQISRCNPPSLKKKYLFSHYNPDVYSSSWQHNATRGNEKVAKHPRAQSRTMNLSRFVRPTLPIRGRNGSEYTTGIECRP